MNTEASTGTSATLGRVASLHLHPAEAGTSMQTVDNVQVVADQGILGDLRYFGRKSNQTGGPSKRQISLIEREQIAAHATKLGVDQIPPGAVRSNIETTGIELGALVGREIQVGEAILLVSSRRDPCAEMDAVHQGLRELMCDGRQGVMAQVIRSGWVRTGDEIRAQGNWDS